MHLEAAPSRANFRDSPKGGQMLGEGASDTNLDVSCHVQTYLRPSRFADAGRVTHTCTHKKTSQPSYPTKFTLHREATRGGRAAKAKLQSRKGVPQKALLRGEGGFLPAFKRLPYLREETLCVPAEQLSGEGFFGDAEGNSCSASPGAEGAGTKWPSCTPAACLRAFKRGFSSSAPHAKH